MQVDFNNDGVLIFTVASYAEKFAIEAWMRRNAYNGWGGVIKIVVTNHEVKSEAP